MLHAIHTEEAKRMIDFLQRAKYKELYMAAAIKRGRAQVDLERAKKAAHDSPGPDTLAKVQEAQERLEAAAKEEREADCLYMTGKPLEEAAEPTVFYDFIGVNAVIGQRPKITENDQ